MFLHNYPHTNIAFSGPAFRRRLLQTHTASPHDRKLAPLCRPILAPSFSPLVSCLVVYSNAGIARSLASCQLLVRLRRLCFAAGIIAVASLVNNKNIY